jgi:chromosome segregation ATPase
MKTEAARTDTLLQLVRDHDGRSETQMNWINQLGAAQANTEAKVAAIADGMIHLQEAQANSEAKISALAEAQGRTEEALARLTGRVDALSETVGRYISERRNGESQVAKKVITATCDIFFSALFWSWLHAPSLDYPTQPVTG